jgi:cyanophycin synthetase
MRGIDTVEQLADVKAVVVEAVPRDGHAVLNADDPLVREMRRRCSGQVVWFSMDEPGSEVREMIEAHCRRGGKALVLNVQPDHLGLRGIDTVEQLADVKAVIVEAVPRDGHAVLNADDPLVRAMRRKCSGQVVWFSMSEPGSEEREMIDAHCRRGGKALVLEPSERGEMIVVKHGRREMQLAWTHLLPATFGGKARMNVQNALAAAAAAFAAGAPLHDIRQGLRTFSTSYYLSPGRLNEVEVNGVQVIVDYCHNAPGMKALGDFVDRVGESMATTSDLGRPSRIGVIATAGDRRDDDMRELGAIAAQHFDVVVVREDVALRGRERGATAELVAEGVRESMAQGARCRQLEIICEEIEAVRHAMSRANPGDLVVVCVDKHPAVMAELETWSQRAQAGSAASDVPLGDPDFTPAPAQQIGEEPTAERAPG